MTTTTTTKYRARRKKKMKESEFNDEDLISKLPDPLLHHIFSFLDMKFVIQTSILSRRWRYFWISQPIMNFDQKLYNPPKESLDEEYSDEDDFMEHKAKYKCFIRFVKRALLLHGTNSKIHTVRLSCMYGGGRWYDYFPLDFWVPILDRLKVEVIDVLIESINMFHSLQYTRPEFPACLFRCKSLTALKLDLGGPGWGNYKICTVPSDCRFRSPLPSLKTLHLRSFCLDNDFQKFLSKCPVLETLVISNCSLYPDNIEGLYIQHRQLKNLVVETTNTGRIRVIAPNLESFSGRADPINDYCFENIESLVKADIDVDFVSSYDYCPNVEHAELLYSMKTADSQKVMECLRGLSNVRSLKLSAWLLELAIEYPDGLGNLPMKPFCYLRLLTLKTSLSKSHICAITNLLENCPNLETLVVKMTMPPPCSSIREVHSNPGEEKECWEAELAPLCEMHHLKVVEIWDVEAAQNEFEFVKFLLKNATMLEKMILYTSKTQSPNNKWELKRFGEKLTTLPGVSSRIGIFML